MKPDKGPSKWDIAYLGLFSLVLLLLAYVLIWFLSECIV